MQLLLFFFDKYYVSYGCTWMLSRSPSQVLRFNSVQSMTEYGFSAVKLRLHAVVQSDDPWWFDQNLAVLKNNLFFFLNQKLPTLNMDHPISIRRSQTQSEKILGLIRVYKERHAFPYKSVEQEYIRPYFSSIHVQNTWYDASFWMQSSCLRYDLTVLEAVSYFNKWLYLYLIEASLWNKNFIFWLPKINFWNYNCCTCMFSSILRYFIPNIFIYTYSSVVDDCELWSILF
jgi:hypothetical protein